MTLYSISRDCSKPDAPDTIVSNCSYHAETFIMKRLVSNSVYHTETFITEEAAPIHRWRVKYTLWYVRSVAHTTPHDTTCLAEFHVHTFAVVTLVCSDVCFKRNATNFHACETLVRAGDGAPLANLS